MSYAHLSSIGTTLITEGETSEPFYFTTLPTSPPSKLSCVSEGDSLTVKWNNPTAGMVDETVYRYAYRLLEGTSVPNSGIASGKIKEEQSRRTVDS